MKNLFKKTLSKKLFSSIPIAFVILVLVAAVGLAAWGATSLTSTGTVTITEAPTPLNYTYSVTPEILDFSGAGVGGTWVEFNVDVTVTNNGDQTIGYCDISHIGGTLPTGFAMVYTGYDSGDFPLVPGDSGVIRFTLKSESAPVGAWDVSGQTFTLTPQY